MRKSLLFLFLTISVVATAAIPSGYYTSANGKNKADLRSALQTIITNGHSVTSYSGLWTAYKTTDINPSTGKIWDIYSNCSFTYSTSQCGTYSSECDCYNREHTNPQSWFSSASPMLRYENESLKLVGKRPVRIFRHGQLPREISENDNLDFLLK